MEIFKKILKGTGIFLLIVLVLILLFNILNCLKSVSNWWNDIFHPNGLNIETFADADINHNGGLTKIQIKNQKEDPNCPSYEDVIDELHILDYNDFVCFYKEVQTEDNETIYPNIVFVKSASGLKFNGALNMNASCYVNFFATSTSINVWQDYDSKPILWEANRYLNSGNWYTHTSNLCLLDSSSINFCKSDGVCISPFVAIKQMFMTESVLKSAQSFLIKSIYPYFLTFNNGNIEIIQDVNSSSGDFNFFYDYIYRTAKSHDYGENKTSGVCCVDCTELSVYPLPEDLQETYLKDNTVTPIEYFKIYKCNVFLNCSYEKINLGSEYKKNRNLINIIKDEPIEIKEIPVVQYNKLTLALKPKTQFVNATIKTIVETDPVTVRIFDSTEVLYRTIIFDRDDFINCLASKDSALVTGSYTYEILSNQILFDSYSGSFSIDALAEMELTYDYKNGFVNVSMAINPLNADFDFETIDLSNTPVQIMLHGQSGEGNYTFLFNANSDIDLSKILCVKIGTYDLTILSDSLRFATNQSVVTISAYNRNFRYSFVSSSEELELLTNVNQTSSVSLTSGKFNFTISKDSLNAYKQYFETLDMEFVSYSNALVQIQEHGSLLSNEVHFNFNQYDISHSGENFTDYNFSCNIDNLQAGKIYDLSFALEIITSESDGCSGPIFIEFTYQNNIEYSFDYTISVI